MLGGAASHAAISQPGSGNSDLVLFAEVLNASGGVVASYAGDTGISVATATGGSLPSETTLGSDANLFELLNIAQSGGGTLVWGVQGGAYTGSIANFGTPGIAEFVSTFNGGYLDPPSTSVLQQWGRSLGGTISQLNANLNGHISVEGAIPSGAGIWDATQVGNVSFWYSSDPSLNTGIFGLGSATTLYGITGSGATGLVTPEATVSLSEAGLTFVSNSSTVPLPASSWLMLSGLGGLGALARKKRAV